MINPVTSPRPSFWARLAAPIGVLVAPRRTGRIVARGHLVSALAVHLLALVLVAAVVVSAAEIIQRLDTGSSRGSSALAILGHLLRGTLTGTTAPLRLKSFILVTAATVAVGEAFYWATSLIVLGAWSGLSARPGRLFGRAAVLAGYASMWLVPLAASWAAGACVFTHLYMHPLRMAATDNLLLVIIGVLIGLLPALMVAGALRLAQGAGDVLADDPPPPDKNCERCGYNLHATPFDGICPECGLAAIYSLSPIHRTHPWEIHRGGYFRTMAGVIFTPGKAFSRFRTASLTSRARRFLWLSDAFSAAILYPLIALAATRFGGGTIINPLSTPLVWTGVWIVTVPIASMFCAGVLTGAARRRGDRLSPRGAAKVACYLSALAIPWAAIIGILVVVVFEAQARGLMPHKLTLSHQLLAAIIGIGLLLWYWIIASRAYASCRYANT